MDKQDFKSLLQRQAAGKTGPEEDRLIALIWTRIYKGQAPFDWDPDQEEDVKKSIQRKIKVRIGGKESTPNPFLPAFMKAAAAALVLLTAGLGYRLFTHSELPAGEMIVKTTDATQRAKITLPDGSIVQLNVSSTLSYPSHFTADSREVKLEGEAFFDVVPDTLRPFYVQSGGLETKVLGTRFNVNAYRNKEEMVTVKSGKVQVSVNQAPGQQVFLQPNEAAIFELSSASLSKRAFDADKIIGWKSGKLDFEMVPFDQAIATLGRYYHTDIILKNYREGGCMIKASYENNGLNFILSGLQLLVEFEFERQEDGSIVITYQSCKQS